MCALYINDEFRSELSSAASKATRSITVLAGFVRSEAIDWLSRSVAGRPIDVSIGAGWTIDDLASGASDLDAYRRARELGWRFGILPGLHAKIYWIDGHDVLVGSAN